MENEKAWDWAPTIPRQNIETSSIPGNILNPLREDQIESVDDSILDSTDDENVLLDADLPPLPNELVENALDSDFHEENLRLKKKRKNNAEEKRCQRCGKIIMNRTHCDKCRKAISRGSTSTNVGRPQKPLSEHTNPSTKISHMIAHLNKWTGSASETQALLDLYVAKHLPTERKLDEIYSRMGRSVCKFVEKLPPNSTFRQPLIQAVGEGLQPHHLQKVLSLSRATLSHSLNLPSNIFLTTAFNRELLKKNKEKQNKNESQLQNPQEIQINENNNQNKNENGSDGGKKRPYPFEIESNEDQILSSDYGMRSYFNNQNNIDQNLLLNQIAHPLQLPIPNYNARENYQGLDNSFGMTDDRAFNLGNNARYNNNGRDYRQYSTE